MRGKKWWLIGIGVLVLVLWIGVTIVKQTKGKVESVQLARVRVEDVTSRVRAPGKIEPSTQVKISADIMGKIIRLAVKEGDRVKKGQLLLQLDDAQYRATYNQSRAAAASARARRSEAEAAMKVSDANYTRQKALFEQKLLSQAEWDQATSNHESARTALSSAQEEVTRSEAAMTGAADNLSKTRFVAPIDGMISALNVEAGEIVIMGTMNNPGTEILVVSDMSRMLVRADVDETDVVDMRIGQAAKITVDALPDTSFMGTVTEIGNTAKRSAAAAVEGQTNFEVKVVFDKDVPEVRPGMTADVEIETGTHAKTTAVPIQAVVVRTERELQRAARGAKRAAPRKKPENVAVSAEEDTAGRKEK